MIVFVNSKVQEIAKGASLTKLAELLRLSDKGVAIAVNNRMVPRTEWNGFSLKENDNIVIIKAACGG